jgi:ribonuclease PH
MIRPSGRKPEQIRPVFFEMGYAKYAEGSCLVKFGETHVLCTASVEEKVPIFIRNSGKGWITAEYGMLPRSTHNRMDREAVKGKQSGRTQEIQRLIGRSLRSVTNLSVLGERQVKVDCDVLQADGGTRTAAITGSWLALHQAFTKLIDKNIISSMPLTSQVAAISCGIYNDVEILDLDYDEDSHCQVDSNFILTNTGKIIEIQGTAEESPFSEKQFFTLLSLAKKGVEELSILQKKALDVLA